MYNDDYIKQVLGDDYNNKNLLRNYESEPNYDDNIYPKEMYKQTHNIISTDVSNNSKEKNDGNSNKSKEIKDIDIETKQVNSIVNKTKNEFEKFYPEIYKMIIPMIENLVSRNEHMTFTQEVIETMVNEIYNYVEDDIITDDIKKNSEISNKSSNNDTVLVHANPYRRRKPKNTLLYDLIKILLLNRLCII